MNVHPFDKQFGWERVGGRATVSVAAITNEGDDSVKAIIVRAQQTADFHMDMWLTITDARQLRDHLIAVVALAETFDETAVMRTGWLPDALEDGVQIIDDTEVPA